MHKLKIIVVTLFLTLTGQSYDLSKMSDFLSQGDLKSAKNSLAEEYLKAKNSEEQQQLEFVAAQLFMQEKNYEQAAAIYRRMLVKNPSLTRVRLELGYAYFMLKEDDKARYNLRLTLTDKTLPPNVRQQVLNLLEIIRKRKSWGIYVSIGMSPDTNINMVSGRRMSCINFMGTPICHELDNVEKDIGFQGFASLEYIYKFTDSWGIKSRLTLDALDYKDDTYSFWGIGGSLGPRYVSNHGEYSIGVTYRQQYNDEHRYNHTKGLYADMSMDLSNRLYLYGRLAYNKIEYNPYLYQMYDSNNYSGYARLAYSLNNHSYMTLSASLAYDNSKYKWNSYLRQTYGIGYGRELPWGFMIYAEPNISFVHYQDKRYFINGLGGMEEWKRRDTTYGIYVSLSSKLLRIYNITPTINYIYNKRISNVFNYEYERNRFEIGISRSF